MTSKLKLLVASSIIPASIMGASSANAAGTLQGTDVNNSVTVNFTVGGVAQTPVTSNNTFKVDRKVIFTVAESTPTGATKVYPGQAGAVTTFTVSNTSNDTLDFNLGGTQLAAGTANTKRSLDDAFDISSMSIFADSPLCGVAPVATNGTCGVYEPAIDTATVVDNLAPDTSRSVFIVGSVPLSAANGKGAGVVLTGTARNSDGTAITYATDSTANAANVVETIAADEIGVSGSPPTGVTWTARDGIVMDSDDYQVYAATIKKYQRVVSDGISATNPKAIPGAVVEYCLAITNPAGAPTSITGVSFSDDLNAPSVGTTVTYDSSFTPKQDGTAVTVTDATNNVATCTPGATNATYTPNVTPSLNGVVSTTGTLSTLNAGDTRTLVFRATIK